MDLTRAVIAYLTAVFVLLGSAGFFLNRALAPLPEAEAKTAAASKPLAPKLLNSVERRAQDAALMQRLAEEAERRAHPAPVETTGTASTVSASAADDGVRRGEAKANRKSKARSLAERKPAPDPWYQAWGYDRSWRYTQRGF
jgi:hypothetical protein